MELSADTIRRYIPKSWKKITAYVTSTITSPDEIILSVFYRELEKNYSKYHCQSPTKLFH
jgi:hypothetical protein